MKDLQMPALGMAMTEGVILQWLRSPGEEVAEGEPLAEIETEKSIVVIESPASGTLGEPQFAVGDVVPVGASMVSIVEAGDNSGAPPVGAGQAQPAATVGGTAASAVVAPPGGPAGQGTGSIREPHRLSPRQRRLVREQGAGDAPQDTAGQLHPAAAPAADGELADRADRARAAIAARVSQSWQTMPHFGVTRELDAEPLLAWRGRGRRDVPDLGVTDLLCRALGIALGNAPPVCVGLAVDTSVGVLIPVLPDVVGTDLAGLVAQRQAAVARARAGRADQGDAALHPEATVSNLGSYGVDHFTGIVPPGQGLLLTVGRIAPRVVVADGVMAIRRTFVVTLVGDHRRYDGAQLARIVGSFDSVLQGALDTAAGERP
jgi:pyruvate dehydrogenase E2 component (dihydrolipoamide acetyltransferase)